MQAAELGNTQESWLENGLNLVYSNKFDEALRLFSEKLDYFTALGDHEKQAEALFGLGIYHGALWCSKKSKEYFRMAWKAVTLAYPGEEEKFLFYPMLRNSLEKKGSEETLALVNAFIETQPRGNSAQSSFLALAYLHREEILIKLGHEGEKRKDAIFQHFSSFYPQSTITLLCKAFSLAETNPAECLEYLSQAETLVPKNHKLLALKGVVLFKLGRGHGEPFKCFTESLELKISKIKYVYMGLVGLSLGNPYTGEFVEILDPYVGHVPATILQVVEQMLPRLAENFPDYKDWFAFAEKRYKALCLFELGSFEEAGQNFRLADLLAGEIEEKERVAEPLRNQVSSYIQERFARFSTQCRQKIEECQAEHYRRTRVVKTIQRALVEATYRPGGPGYHKAFDHFRSLVSATKTE